jgi:hypothetical protein
VRGAVAVPESGRVGVRVGTATVSRW